MDRFGQWIDWNHKDQVKVYVDGADVTDQFDITVDTAKHTTTATAKQSFLTKTAFGTKDRKVKLYIGGYVKQTPNAQAAADQRKLTNKASEKWNNESRPTNEPPVYVRNPKPDKVWSADQGQAATAEDTAWSNKVNADTHTFVQQDDFGVTVNGLLPKNLARKMSSYELGDDFSKSARNIDLDSASVTVTIDGKDANSLFDVHKQDGRVWITAKQPLLDTTYNQAADRKVRMTIKGAFTKGVLKAGQKVQLTNGDWEKWNQQTVPGNEPPVRSGARTRTRAGSSSAMTAPGRPWSIRTRRTRPERTPRSSSTATRSRPWSTASSRPISSRSPTSS